jgi:autotransporter-associated beta strand protein
MKKLLIIMIMAMGGGMAFAQRTTDKLDRGLIAMKASSGVYLSWRILGSEYYDVTYNVYKDGALIKSGLKVSNFSDTSGSQTSTYTVSAVVRGKEQTQSKAASVWSTSYKEIKLKHEGIQSTLIPNDACCADVDGDGELEILMKFDNDSEIQQSYPKLGPKIDGKATGEYSIFEVLKQDGTRLWWVNCGPNMGDFQNNEQNIIAYDWDGDGKAEAVMRAADGTVIHCADGSTYTVGDATKNYRAATGGGVNWFMYQGAEYLVYMDGETGKPYQCITYPLARFESGESTLEKAWGKEDGGHRCSKFFFGAPYLDGRKPSIFLARGIYTRHKMIAYDVDPATHELKVRWKWYNNTNGAWKGQGYHNYNIADVDMDGRDEIIFGSMVIDDNGKGLSTTGLGHGDAMHCGDFNPYAHGLEVFACNEDAQGYNYRDATTSKIYKCELHVGKDVGRSMMDNFSDSYPGSIGVAWGNPVSSVKNDYVNGIVNEGINSNFRIYWDGDLCSETFNGLKDHDSEGVIARYGSWAPIYTCAGSLTNNYTKCTPCYQGDILGDWREEIIMRTADNNIRIYSTPTPTSYRNYTLWHDHQYRNAMAWQMCGYNQPPHTSYFLGKMEDITIAPPPLMMEGREEVTNGGTIGSALNDKHVIVCETDNSEVTIESGASPYILTFNVPTWVQGNGASECTATSPKITYTTYTCNVKGGGISGNARLIKQGDGILTLPKADFTHKGETNIWAGVLNFDGTMKKSPLWLNRFAELNSNGGEFMSIKADYASVIRPGGADAKGDLTTDSLTLGFGSRIILDLYSNDLTADRINLGKYLEIETKTSSAWVEGGPEYLCPVLELVGHLPVGESEMNPGKYIIGTAPAELKGKLEDIRIEGLNATKKKFYIEDGKLIIEIIGLRDANSITWTGEKSSSWNLADAQNFTFNNGQTAESTVFVSGDKVFFNDDAVNKTVNVREDIMPDTITVNASSDYTFTGAGAISGTASFVKEGSGTVTMSGENSYTGGNYLKGGVTKVSLLSNQYSEYGNLGGITKLGSQFTMENGAELQTTAAVEMGSHMTMIGEEGGVINNVSDFKMDKSFMGTLLTKRGNGCLYLNATNSVSKIIMKAGSMALAGNSQPKTIELQGGTLYDDAQNTSHAIIVPKGKSASWQLTGVYYTAYSNKLTGEGTLTIVPRNTVSRVRITGDWRGFTGTIRHTNKSIWLPFDNSTGLPNATLDLADGCTATNVCKTFTIGRLTGKGSLAHPISNFQSQGTPSGSNTWKVGNSLEDGDFTFEGAITDGGGSNKAHFEKIGSCTMTVKGGWSNSGTVKISQGTIKLSGSGLSLGTGALTVAEGATLTGSSSSGLKNSSVVINGTLRPVVTETTALGKLVFNNQDVTLSSTATLRLNIAKASTGATIMSGDNIRSINKLTIDGTISLNFVGYVPAVGDELRLWTGVKTFSGTPTILCEGANVTFDTTRLSEGILIVQSAESTGIAQHLSPNTYHPTPDKIYTLDGKYVGTDLTRLPKGIYLRNNQKVTVK